MKLKIVGGPGIVERSAYGEFELKLWDLTSEVHMLCVSVGGWCRPHTVDGPR